MKIYITVDAEGISGIMHSSQTHFDLEDYHEGRRYITEEVNACVQGALEGGATDVIVADKHGRGKNFIWHDLHEAARYVVGTTPELPGGRLPGIEGSDGLILLGYHAMSGTPVAVLEHTWGHDCFNYSINGRPSGEISMEMGLAADCGVPAIMISGDDKVCAEADTIVPGIVQAEVKKALSFHGAILLSRAAAHKLVREKAAEAVRKCKSFTPVQFATPVTMRWETSAKSVWYNIEDKPYARLIDARTLEVSGDTFTQAFYRIMRK